MYPPLLGAEHIGPLPRAVLQSRMFRCVALNSKHDITFFFEHFWARIEKKNHNPVLLF